MEVGRLGAGIPGGASGIGEKSKEGGAGAGKGGGGCDVGGREGRRGSLEE